jgi:Lrp/AsnC family transcriptional regulator
MEQDGIIRKRVAVLDPDKIGLPVSVFVAVETADHSSEWLARFAAVVQSTPEVVDAWRMSGDVDYLLHVVVPDIAAYDTFYRKLIAAVPLRNVTSRFAMERMKNGPLPIP